MSESMSPVIIAILGIDEAIFSSCAWLTLCRLRNHKYTSARGEETTWKRDVQYSSHLTEATAE